MGLSEFPVGRAEDPASSPLQASKAGKRSGIQWARAAGRNMGDLRRRGSVAGAEAAGVV
jgi:hypothetical protein